MLFSRFPLSFRAGLQLFVGWGDDSRFRWWVVWRGCESRRENIIAAETWLSELATTLKFPWLMIFEPWISERQVTCPST